MKPKFILINPWIYDFAAANMWSRPLGLLKVAEYLGQFDVDLHFIDCTNTYVTKRKYGTGKYPRQIIKKPDVLKSVPKNYARYGITIDQFKEKLKSHLPCDGILLTSIMSYWYPGVQKAVEIVRSLSPGIPVILGGIYASLYHRHASEHSGADVIFRGHAGISASDFLAPPHTPTLQRGELKMSTYSHLNIKSVIENLGIKLTRTGTFLPYYKLPLYEDYTFAPIMTSSGCPYRCTYCASSSLFNGFRQREPSDVIREIKELYTMGVRDYAFYDDALLINADTHLKIVLRELIISRLNIRFHCPNGVHARCIDDELARLMKKAGFSTLRLSLETINTERQAQTGGKVSTDVFRQAVQNLKAHGFTKEQIGVYLMYGLPRQELKEVDEGVEFLKSLGLRINLTEFSPLPNTSCWNELVTRGVISDNIDPLLTNNSVFSLLFSGYDIDALEKIRVSVNKYNSICD